MKKRKISTKSGAEQHNNMDMLENFEKMDEDDKKMDEDDKKMDEDDKIRDFFNAKIQLSLAIQNVTQFSQIFFQTVEIPQEKILGLKLLKLKMAIETADLLLNSLKDILDENNIADVNIKTEPTEENVDVWPINITEVNIQSKPTEEEVDSSTERISMKSESSEEKVDAWPSNIHIADVNINSGAAEEKVDICPINIAEVNIKSETTEEDTAIEANPIDIAGIQRNVRAVPLRNVRTVPHPDGYGYIGYPSNEIKRKMKILKAEAVIKKYECQRHEKCTFKARDNYGLQNHYRSKHEEGPVPCSKPWCKVVLDTLFEKEIHIKTCIITCSVCGKSFNRGGKWDSHQNYEAARAKKLAL